MLDWTGTASGETLRWSGDTATGNLISSTALPYITTLALRPQARTV